MVLSIIIPVFNEAKLVCDLLQKVVDLCLGDEWKKEIVVVDDGSSDETYSVVEGFMAEHGDVNMRLLRHQVNQGKGAAVRTGMEAAQGDILIIQDADLEYDPEDIPAVAQPIVDGSCKVVYGSRILREKALGRSGVFGLITGKHPHSYVMAYLGGVAITKFVNLLHGSKLTDEPTCYKCFHRDALEGVKIESNDFAWEPELTVKLLRKGYRIEEVPISYHPRKRDEGKKINWKDGVRALWAIAQFSFR
jgi:glycosyltransferase involved in cell wall biosynthesis